MSRNNITFILLVLLIIFEAMLLYGKSFYFKRCVDICNFNKFLALNILKTKTNVFVFRLSITFSPSSDVVLKAALVLRPFFRSLSLGLGQGGLGLGQS